MNNDQNKALTLGLITAGAIAVGYSLIGNQSSSESETKPEKAENKSYLDAD